MPDKKPTMPKTFLPLLLVVFLAACAADINLPLPVSTPVPGTPSRTPRIVTLVPLQLTSSITPSPDKTFTSMPALTPTVTLSPTLESPILEVSVLGCDTGLDLAHQMGEVTNVYVSLSNNGGSAASNVCALFSSTDEDRAHPDRMSCVLSLPPETRVTFKLTVDTGFGVDTRIRVDVSAAEKVSTSLLGGSCKAIGPPMQELAPFGVVQPVQ
jgi:hypothetical protein